MSHRPHVSEPSEPPQSLPNILAACEAHDELEISSQTQYEITRPPTGASGDGAPTMPSRSIGMEAILNPSPQTPYDSPSHRNTRGPFESPTSSVSPSAHPRGTPSPILLTSHTEPSPSRLESSISISPGIASRRTLTPRSPAARSLSQGSKINNPVPGTMDVAHSPFLRSPPPHSGAAIPRPTARRRISVQTAPILPETIRHLNPLSQDASPNTPHLPYSYLPHVPTGHPLRHPSPLLPTPPGPPQNELSRPLVPPDPNQYVVESRVPPHGLLPIVVDKEIGSKKAQEKRRKNSHASKRFRMKKKQGEAEQMETLKRQSDTIEHLQQRIELLTEERDYYEAERTYFRNIVYNRVPGGSAIQRPPSPRHEKRGRHLSESESEDREGSSRNVRRRTGPRPSTIPLVTTLHPSPYAPGPLLPPDYSATWPMPISGPPPATGLENPAGQPQIPQLPYLGPPAPTGASDSTPRRPPFSRD